MKSINILYYAILTLGTYWNTIPVYSQGYDNIWLFGYDDVISGPPSGQPWGGTNIDFSSGIANLSYVPRKLDFTSTNSSISNTNGDLIIYTNGLFIANATNDTMLNGGGLNPGWYSAQNTGYSANIPQSALILPQPGNDSIFYLFHSTMDTVYNSGDAVAFYLYNSVINMHLDNGLGAVTSKNNIIITDDLNLGKITATRHGNGRDWWIVCHKYNSNIFYKLLLTPNGIQGPFIQSIGMIRNSDLGQVSFSPNGSRYAYYWSVEGEQGAELFDFDRCSGNFSNDYYLNIQDTAGGACGVAFSPNSNVLYVSANENLYQFDCSAANINSTKYVVAEWDSFYSPPGPPFATNFNKSLLGPNGKIYISSSGSSLYLHVINNPDSLGSNCNVVQHGVLLPTYNLNGIPNYPFFNSGTVIGSICDSLSNIVEQIENTIQIYPNPTSYKLSIIYNSNLEEHSYIELVDLLGHVVYRTQSESQSLRQVLDVSNFNSGVYIILFRTGNSTFYNKFIKY